MKTIKIKSTPLRMCIACRQMLPKRDLIRIVRSNDGQFCLDYTSKAAGRGAYICNNAECMELCIKKKMLNKAFGTSVGEAVYEQLREDYAKRED